ncbi:hypothetical protein [Crateriforma conspicua]|uniref:DUF4412 domain-containing protein n=2 Tax=Crateriforma conspicua TaxID=2527996 RepID=A0A5C5Y1Z8_9PLAN|nr:hypothetical protein [Crateriforma conspicua]TWT69796.1 hypothetical protein Pan14r_20890 [Crateriforma conspicua]
MTFHSPPQRPAQRDATRPHVSQRRPLTQTAIVFSTRSPWTTVVAIGAVMMFAMIQTASAQSNVRPASYTPAGRMASFRVNNVVSDHQGRTLADHDVLFQSGKIYDFSNQQPRFITLIDIAGSRVVLLDTQTKVKASIATETLLQVAAQAQSLAAEQGKAARLGVNVPVNVSDDQAIFTTNYGDDVVGQVTYQVETEAAKDRLMPIAYGQFIDWFGRLDIARKTGSLPFARMSVHQQLQGNNRLPLRTTMTVRRGSDSQTLTATHTRHALNSSDLKRIDEVAGMLTLFKEVDLKDFPATH